MMHDFVFFVFCFLDKESCVVLLFAVYCACRETKQNNNKTVSALVAYIQILDFRALLAAAGRIDLIHDTARSDKSMKFTEELRAAAGPQWDRVIQHKFTNELADGTIDRAVLTKYLVQDHRFLDSFVILLSSIIANARCLSDRIPGCQFLALITGKENTYFERSLQKLGAENNVNIPDAPCTSAFCNLMREVAKSGSLGEMLAVIVVCEWSYLCWGERVLPITNRDDFVTYEWVDLHSGEYFTRVVEYLRNLLDKEGAILDEQGKEACKKRFLEAVQCEEDFFDYAYSDD